jgi:hypothetical protein
MSDSVKKKIGLYFVYGLSFIVFAYACISIYRIVTTSAPDFEVYYGSAERLVKQESLSDKAIGYPGFSVVVFVPFLLFPYSVAQGLWVIISFLLLPMIVYITGKILTIRLAFVDILLWICVSFLFFPARFTLGMGQSNIVSLSLLLMSIWMIQKKKIFISGIILGIAFLFKPHIVLLFPFLLLTNMYIPVIIALAIGLVSFGFSVLWLGNIGLSDYQTFFSLPFTGFVDRDVYYNQGLSGLFSRIAPSIAQILSLSVSLLVYGGSLLFAYIKKITFPVIILFALPILLLVEPLAWQHHFVFLIPVIVFLFYRFHTMKVAVCMLIFSYCLIGFNIRNPELFQTGSFGSLILSHGTLGTILLTGLMILSLRKA